MVKLLKYFSYTNIIIYIVTNQFDLKQIKIIELAQDFKKCKYLIAILQKQLLQNQLVFHTVYIITFVKIN